MDYTHKEMEILDLLDRTDFKNIKKNEFVSYASKIGELRPEVAKAVLEQYPELVGLLKGALVECKEMLANIVQSDDASEREYFNVVNKEMDTAADSRKQFNEMIKMALEDCSKLLDKPNLSTEEAMLILNQELGFC